METEPRKEQKSTQAAPAARRSCWAALDRWVPMAGFAYIAVFSIVRVVTAITNWYWLDFARLTPGPLYLIISGALWTIAALIALIWILFRRPWHGLVAFGASLFIALLYWIDRLFISTYPNGTGNTPFAIFLTLFLLAAVYQGLHPHLELRELRKK